MYVLTTNQRNFEGMATVVVKRNKKKTVVTGFNADYFM